MKSGSYAYRFDGASMADDAPYHIVGIGLMKVARGRISGHHRSSVLALKGQNAALFHTEFTLAGAVSPGKDGFLAATITFTCTAADSNGAAVPVEQTLTGTFDFVPAGPDRYWLISSGARNKTLKSWAAEAAMGELVRIGR